MKISIIGMGPAGLMVGYQLLKRGMNVEFYDQKKAAGRKFLVAGHGGFNLTHSKPVEEFIQFYNHIKIQQAVLSFDNEATIHWLNEIGIPTFVGSSGKIFPQKGIKPIEVLDAWLQKIKELGGVFNFEHSFDDWNLETVIVSAKEERKELSYDKLIFALGGASWKKTGSDGSWAELFSKKGIEVVPFQSSNAGMNCSGIVEDLQGTILKNCQVSLGAETRFGEILFTEYGLEGTPIYALNAAFRDENRTIKIDLKPTMTSEKILKILSNKRWNRTQQLLELKLPKSIIQLIKSKLSKESYLNDNKVLEIIKSLTFKIDSLRPIDEAISTVGGVSMDAVDANFELINYPNTYVIGEMLDWDAPTGGYLLQACYSMGVKVGESIK